MPSFPAETCVVNFADPSRADDQRLLVESLRDTGYSGEIMTWSNETVMNASCPPHRHTPYAFRPFAVWEAASRGFSLILWMNATARASSNPEPLFQIANDTGHALWGAQKLGEWASDACLGRFSLPRDEAMDIPLIDGQSMAFSIKSDRTRKFLGKWIQTVIEFPQAFRGGPDNIDGSASFDGRCLGHRSDLSVASALAAKIGMTVNALRT